MAVVVEFRRYAVRGGTAANLATVNEILFERELCYETDTGKAKLGDGTTPWNELDYLPGEGGAGGAPIELRATSTHLQYREVGEPTWIDLIALSEITGADGEDSTVPGPAGPPGPANSTYPTASFDGGNGPISVGASCDLFVPFGFTITRATLLSKQAGSIVIDVRVDTYGNFPPTGGDSICGGAKPALVAAVKSQNGSLTGWTTAIPSGSTVRFVVESVTDIRQVTLMLEGTRT